MTIAARKTVSGTGPAASTASTSRRERRCAERSSPPLAQPAEVEDAAEPGPGGGAGEAAGHQAVARRVVPLRRHHGMHEIEGGAAPPHRRGQDLVPLLRLPRAGRGGDLPGDDLHPRVTRPGPVGELPRGSRQAAHGVPRGEEPRHQPATDVTGGPRSQRREGEREASGGNFRPPSRIVKLAW
jgi:hypothetical protein